MVSVDLDSCGDPVFEWHEGGMSKGPSLTSTMFHCTEDPLLKTNTSHGIAEPYHHRHPPNLDLH